MIKPKPIYISRLEGNELEPFTGQGGEAHAVWFSDGSVFDCYNGWRPPNPFRKPIVRVPMGRA